MSKVVEAVRQILQDDLNAEHIEIIDNSWKHAGHAGNTMGGSHIDVTVVSPDFEGLNAMQRHRLVHKTLKHLMDTHIHALELKAIPSSQWNA